MELKYDMIYECYDHEDCCSENECIYEIEEIQNTIIISDNYLNILWYLFVILRKKFNIDSNFDVNIIYTILNLRLELLNFIFKKIDYKDKDINIKYCDNEKNLFNKYLLAIYINNNKIKKILGKNPKGYKYPSYYCDSIRPSTKLYTHQHIITIKNIFFNHNKNKNERLNY